MIIRNFKGSDIGALISCFNSALPHDATSREQFIRKVFLEENFDPDGLFIAEENGRILGFVCCVYRKVPIDAHTQINPTEGWISAFAIDEKERFFEMDDVRYIAATSLTEGDMAGGSVPDFGEHSELIRELIEEKA